MSYTVHPCRGKYIALEGPDRAGKTTQAQMLISHLQARGVEATQVSEPGTTKTGRRIRKLLMESPGLSESTQFGLFTAARCDIAQEVVVPSLRENFCVVSDRTWLSSLVYQNSRADSDTYDAMASITTRLLPKQPDLTIILLPDCAADLDERRPPDSDPFETKMRDLNPVALYKTALRFYRQPLAIISAMDTPDRVHEQIVEVVNRI